MKIIKKILRKIIQFHIDNNLFSNVNKFSKGDYVIFNWKAKIEIPTILESEPGIKRITEFKNYNDGSQSCKYYNLIDPKLSREEYYCDVFWLRKASRREIKKHNLQYGTIE